MYTVHQSPFFVIFLVLHLQQLQIQDAAQSRPHARGLAMGSSIHSRPRPSHDITSLIHIQEIPGSKYDPRSINNAKLKLKLGRHFDPEFMSIYPPEDLNTTTTVQPEPKKPNLKKIRQKGRNGGGGKYNHDNDVVLGSGTMLDYGAVAEKFHGRLRFKFIRKLEKFLQVYTSCPLQYRWRDLGVRFWPRYLREGHCQGQQYNDAPSNTRTGVTDSLSSSSSPIRSCSIPPGLYCQPSAQVYKVLLRWHCQNWEHRKRCRWLEIRHPVITACSCGTCAMTAS